jgi:selT/selW/selH-like putative selenoprotein
VKQEIEKAFPGSKVEGNTKGSPRTGAFEVTDEKGNVYHSKLNGGGFPMPGDVTKGMKDKGYTV